MNRPLMTREQLKYLFTCFGIAKEDSRTFTDIEYYNFVSLELLTTIFHNYLDDKDKDRFIQNLSNIAESLERNWHEEKNKEAS